MGSNCFSVLNILGHALHFLYCRLSTYLQVLTLNKMLARSFRASKSFGLSVVCIAVFSDVFTYGMIVPVMPFALTEKLGVPESDIQK